MWPIQRIASRPGGRCPLAAVVLGVCLLVSIPASVRGDFPCTGDCEAVPDGSVGVTDFLTLLAEWGQVGAPCDFDGGGVGVTDFLTMLSAWGTCPECDSGSDCNDGDPCTADACVDGQCVHTPIEPCCGNGIVEPGEECDPPHDEACPGTCDLDCLCEATYWCGHPQAGDCCDPAGNGTPYCDDFFCCDFLCSIDPYCCEVEWDAQCASIAATTCVHCG